MIEVKHMSIIVNLDVMMARRKIGLSELAAQVDITLANLSILKNKRLGRCASQHSRPYARRLTASRATCSNIKRTNKFFIRFLKKVMVIIMSHLDIRR
jgi:hypothetical protein